MSIQDIEVCLLKRKKICDILSEKTKGIRQNIHGFKCLCIRDALKICKLYI